MATDAHLSIGTRLGNYELTGFVGEGGMGTVYAAVHLGLGKRVAIKTLRAELASDPEVRMRFLREGKAAAAVRHINVVDVDDVGVFGDTPYLVMELLEGEDLGSQVSRLGRLSVVDTVDVMVPVLHAMAEAHRAGVVHRDLKPDNIFIARDYHGLEVPKVLDFGISKLRETEALSLTGKTSVLGTPFYMSPEQAGSARDVDARSDLYSIGVILYHCVTGRVPFQGTSLVHVLGQILHAEPIPLRELLPDVPAAFERVVLRAMEKNPAARHADALSLARELLPFASQRVQLSYRENSQLRGLQDTLIDSAPQPRAAAAPTPAAAKTSTPLAQSVAAPALAGQPSRRWLPLLLLAAALGVAAIWYLTASSRQPPMAAGAPPAVVVPAPAPALELEAMPEPEQHTPEAPLPSAAGAPSIPQIKPQPAHAQAPGRWRDEEPDANSCKRAERSAAIRAQSPRRFDLERSALMPRHAAWWGPAGP